MKKRLLAYLLLILGLGLMFTVNADANNSTLADILEFQPNYKKSGNIKHGGKKYNFWTKTDKKSLDGKERKVVAISVSEKNSGKTIEQYYINYYQTGVVEYSKLLDPKNASGDVWTIDKNPEDLLWYSERIAYWKKNKNGKDVSIGKWKTRDTKEWLYGAWVQNLDTKKESWDAWGYTLNDVKSQSGLSKKEQKRLFLSAKKRAAQGEKIIDLLSKLEKKYYAKYTKIIKEDLPKMVKKNDKEEVPIEQKILEEKLDLALEELAKLKNELKKIEDSNTPNITTNEKYYALIIGNNNYEHLEKLDAAENDAKVLANILEKNYGFEVELLLNSGYDNTVNSLFAMTNKLKQNDNLLIYYAGHGELDKAENRGYWLPVDASYDLRSKWISNARVVDRIKATKAKHVLLMVDSCFSGTLMRSGTTPEVKETIDEKYIKRLMRKKTRLVITSGGNEPVVDSVGGRHSLFASKLIKTLRDNNTVINSQILFENIRRYVVSNADQTPERAMVHKTGHDGGDFLFFPVN
ncbi:caspase family protein [Candidatus Pelagibacter sp.]|nr:caspase family protein [Candidatus Pelagibacter sp.]